MIVGTSLTRRTAKFALEQQAVVAHTVRSATAGCTCSVRYALVRMRTMCRSRSMLFSPVPWLPSSAPALGSPLPHLRRHWAHPCLHWRGDWARPLPTSAPGLGSPCCHVTHVSDHQVRRVWRGGFVVNLYRLDTTWATPQISVPYIAFDGGLAFDRDLYRSSIFGSTR